MMINVSVVSNATGKVTPVTLETPATIQQALNQAGMGADGATVRLNNQPVKTLTQTLGDGDRISVTQANLKAAEGLSFEDLLKRDFKKVEKPEQTIVQQAASERLEQKRNEAAKYYAQLLQDSERVEATAEEAVNELAREFDALRESHERTTYCIHELRNGNPYPFIALTGRKCDTADLCRKIGVSVPASDSCCWNTSPPKAQAKG